MSEANKEHTFEKLKAEWAESEEKFEKVFADSAGLAAIFNVKVYSRFVNHLSNARWFLSKMESERQILDHDLTEYYLKRETPDVRKKLGKAEGFGVKILAKDVDNWVNVDPAMILSNLRIAKQDEKVEWIKNILKSIHDRGWAIKNFIDNEKLRAGIGGA